MKISSDGMENLEKTLSQIKIQQKTILSVRETCEYLGVSSSFIYKLTRDRKIPHSCPEGKLIFFNRVDVEEWALQNPRKTIGKHEEEALDSIVV